MTLNEFLNKYNKCPFCEEYVTGQRNCLGCCFRYPEADGFDHFQPVQEWFDRINKEVTENGNSDDC